MDASVSNPALLANAELLKRFLGKRVRTVVKIMQEEGANLHCQSSDGQNITVRQVVKVEDFTNFVEVIGVADGPFSVRCEKCTNFGENFGKHLIPIGWSAESALPASFSAG